MGIPTIKSGRFQAGADFQCGENVVINVAEEVVVGDRVRLPDNCYIEGRRVKIGNDFYGYDWEWRRLDIGRGRIDEEDAILKVGDCCTFHDNRIDLARHVTIGYYVGLSPEVAIYTHYYWMSPLEGFPMKYAPVQLGDGTIAGFRSVFLPGSDTDRGVVVGANSTVSGYLEGYAIYGGNPAKWMGDVNEVSVIAEYPESPNWKEDKILDLIEEYRQTVRYRNLTQIDGLVTYKLLIGGPNFTINAENGTLEGDETPETDDLRDFLFKHGIRIYTERPFRKLPRRVGK